jgi:hypothetical protein
MIPFVLTFILALVWSVAVGSIFTVLWNLAPSGAFGLPPVTWVQGIGIYLVIRLLLSPPTLDLTLGSES